MFNFLHSINIFIQTSLVGISIAIGSIFVPHEDVHVRLDVALVPAATTTSNTKLTVATQTSIQTPKSVAPQIFLEKKVIMATNTDQVIVKTKVMQDTSLVTVDSTLTPPKDTDVVTGYVWESDPGSPHFQSVFIPFINLDKSLFYEKFSVYIWTNGKYEFYQDSSQGKEVTFPDQGVSKFKITGIDPAFKLCVKQHVATGLKFVDTGTFKGGMKPITEDLTSSGITCKMDY